MRAISVDSKGNKTTVEAPKGKTVQELKKAAKRAIKGKFKIEQNEKVL